MPPEDPRLKTFDAREGTGDVGTELSSRRTGMSFQRTRMSADRTLMSVIRTSLSLISFGFTIFQLFKKFHEANLLKSSASPRNFGESLVYLGIGMLIVGIAYHVAFMTGLRHERTTLKNAGLIHADSQFPISFTLLAAILLLVIGVVAIIAMVTGMGPLG